LPYLIDEVNHNPNKISTEQKLRYNPLNPSNQRSYYKSKGFSRQQVAPEIGTSFADNHIVFFN
jgi:hypothetical protein